MPITLGPDLLHLLLMSSTNASTQSQCCNILRCRLYFHKKKNNPVHDYYDSTTGCWCLHCQIAFTEPTKAPDSVASPRLVPGYLMGVPVTSYSLAIGQQHVEFAEAKMQARIITRDLTDTEIDALAVAAVAGNWDRH